MTTLLRVRGVSLRFGGLTVLDDVDLDVDAGEIVALIGPNGAGKTTLLNCVSGMHKPAAGSIRYRGQDLVGRPVHQIARLGIARAFQHVQLFSGLTVADNVLVGRHLHFRGPPWLDWIRRAEPLQRAAIEPILRFLELESVRNMRADTLSFGQQKLVGLARALAMQPGLLLLDEPAAGLHAADKAALARVLRRIRDELGIPMLWIEHDIGLVARLASQVAVLDFGKLIAAGPPHTVLRHPRVVRAYLGDRNEVKQ
jgi:branched-chain amino acid transport system ATP-binding protein